MVAVMRPVRQLTAVICSPCCIPFRASRGQGMLRRRRRIRCGGTGNATHHGAHHNGNLRQTAIPSVGSAWRRKSTCPLRLMPDSFIRLPAKMKNGTARNVYDCVCATMRCTAIENGISGALAKKATPAKPMTNATGMPDHQQNNKRNQQYDHVFSSSPLMPCPFPWQSQRSF